jgi:hypothetical protein
MRQPNGEFLVEEDCRDHQGALVLGFEYMSSYHEQIINGYIEGAFAVRDKVCHQNTNRYEFPGKQLKDAIITFRDYTFV